jgi:hypothetical protein
MGISVRALIDTSEGHAEAHPQSCSGSRVGCTLSSFFGSTKAGDTPATTEAARSCYGDFFGEADAFAAAGALAVSAGDVVAASAGFALSSSTSKIRVAFGPISPPAPPGP